MVWMQAKVHNGRRGDQPKQQQARRGEQDHDRPDPQHATPKRPSPRRRRTKREPKTRRGASGEKGHEAGEKKGTKRRKEGRDEDRASTTGKTKRTNERDPSPTAAPSDDKPTHDAADRRQPETKPPTPAGTRDNRQKQRQDGAGERRRGWSRPRHGIRVAFCEPSRDAPPVGQCRSGVVVSSPWCGPDGVSIQTLRARQRALKARHKLQYSTGRTAARTGRGGGRTRKPLDPSAGRQRRQLHLSIRIR